MRVLQATAAAITASLTAIAAEQSPGAAGNLTLATGTVFATPALVNAYGISAGPGKYTSIDPGILASGDFQSSNYPVDGATQLGVALNPPRTVAITSATATSNSGINVTVTGLDRVGMPIQETITGPGGSATVNTKRLFASVFQVSVSGAATDIEAGYDGSSYSRWINVGNFKGAGQVKLSVFAPGGTASTDTYLQVTDMPMNRIATLNANGSGTSAYGSDDIGAAWNGGDLPDNLLTASPALTLPAFTGSVELGSTSYGEKYSSNGSTAEFAIWPESLGNWAAYRLYMTATTKLTVLRVILNRTR